jgi:hypothetical protein
MKHSREYSRLMELFTKVCGVSMLREWYEPIKDGESYTRLKAGDMMTGKAVSVPFWRNTRAGGNKVKGGAAFGQNIEPHGTYMFHEVQPLPSDLTAQGWISGVVHFDNPLVLEYGSTSADGWKGMLSKRFNKKGRALSEFLISRGYDGIITIDSAEDTLSEIVSFKDFR